MKKIVFYITILFPVFTNAQQFITLQNAIDTALMNNFDIMIAKNNVEINKTYNNYGQAGGLPVINANVGEDKSLSNINQNLSNGSTYTNNAANSNTLNANITGSITLFNGFKIVAEKERLNCLQKQSEIQLNQQIQNIIADVMLKYYDIIRQEKYLKIIQNSLDVSNKKLEIVNERNKVGMAAAIDILQAQMDVNSAKQNFMSQQLVIDQAKTELLQIIKIKKYVSFNVNDTIIIDKTLQLDSVINSLNRNPSYLSAEQEVKINEQIIKEKNAQRYPSIKLNATYEFSNSNNDYGSVLSNQNFGPSAGITMQIPLFNGNVFKTQRKVAEFEVKNSKLQQANILNNLNAEAVKAFQSYSSTLQQINSQSENFLLAKKLVNAVMQNFSLNQVTILEVKVAQTSFEEAAYLLINLQYAAKASEIQLEQLIYKLSY
ncbi:MAG: TolC family protein [Bacteroidetes bacterium]|nr:TolC family protein [Bacteroidota bacterium]